MAAAAEIPSPGVEVVQELRTVRPTVVAPTLAPCIMGVCKQILEVLNDDRTVNSDALLSGPAVATAGKDQTAPYNLDGLTLIVSIDGGPNQTFTFAGTNPMTAQQAASCINGSTIPPDGFAAYVHTYVDGTTKYKLQLRTIGTGAEKSIKLVGGTALAGGDPLGWASRKGYTYYGLGTYANVKAVIPQTSLPDPRGIIDELDVDEDTIRCFINLGTEVRELLRTESFLRKGIEVAPAYALTPFDDGDGDATTPYVNLTDGGVPVNLLPPVATAAQTPNGINDLSVARQVHGLTLVMGIDGEPVQTLQLTGQPIVSTTSGTPWNYVGKIQSKNLALTVNGQLVTVAFSAGVATIAGVINEINTAVATALGLGTVVAYRCDQFGAANPAGLYMGLFYGGAPATNVVPNTSVIVENSAGGSTADTVTELFGADLHYYQTNTGEKTDPTQPIPDIEEQIETLWGGNVAYLTAGNLLYIKSTTIGAESKVFISNTSTALAQLGIGATTVWGGAFPLKVGDYLYGDGQFVGRVIEIHSAGAVGRVRLQSEIALTATRRSWYIVAKNLNLYNPTTQWGVIVPTADFYIDTGGQAHVKHDFMRDIQGVPVTTAAVGMYMAYQALRLDVSPEAEDASLLAFDNTDDLEEALGPLVPANPLGYGLYLALQNSGVTRVYGIGVPEFSDDKPFGTVEGWTKVYDFLESQGVYGLAPMTDDLESHLVGRTHVLAMSEPENKGERVMHFYLGKPTREADEIAASGTDGDTIGAAPTAVFDTKLANLSQLLTDAGVNPMSMTVADGVYIDVASDAKHYNVTGAVAGGSQLTVNIVFAPGENDDDFYSLTNFTTALISETFSVMVRGARISADKDKEIETIIARGGAFASRRCRMEQLDKLKATIQGVEQVIDGFYVCAAKVGQISGNAPSTPYTLVPINGFTGVTGTKGYYSERQMNQGAAGGAEWIVQSSPGVPLVSRHQLTTDLTSVESSEQSITNALDYASLFLRAGLRNFIGRYNISDTFLDTLASVVQGMLAWLVEKKVLAGADLNNIIQDATNPTRVLIDCTVQPYYPCNYIRLTLVV